MRSTIQRKLTQLSSLCNSPSADLVSALSSLDRDFDCDDVRSSVEAKELSLISDFVDRFSPLCSRISAVRASLDALDRSCDAVLRKLSVGERGVDEVLDTTTSLRAQQSRQQQQLQSINAFIDRFYLRAADAEALRSGDIGPAFFAALRALDAAASRAAAARAEADAALCLDDALRALAQERDAALQRAHAWLHSHAGALSAPQPALATHRECLRLLRAREFLFGFAVDEVAKVRGNCVGGAFVRALPSLDARAAAAPLQYVGDLFAWAHQSAATEGALLSQLLDEAPSSPHVRGALATVLDALLPPLESRVASAVRSLARPADLYQAANVCTYFAGVFGDVCGLSSSVCRAIGGLRDAAAEAFRKSVSDTIDGMRRGGRASPGDIAEALRTVAEITDTHAQSSLASFDIGVLIDAFVGSLREAVRDARGSEAFRANAMYELAVVCRNANLQSRREVERESEEMAQKIVDAEVDDVLNRSRMAEVLMLAESKRELPLSNVAGLDKNILNSCIRRFETVIVGSGPMIMPVCDTIQNPELKHRTRRKVTDRLAKVYEDLFNAVMEPKNGYDSPNTMFKYTPALVRDMISV